ncbi:MAG: ABC transporter ATP-binding protein [Desulfomonilaceae bacterium]|nr:ABC transporter ATP-binding protein [Desulfomonilaceae bacterium]
MLKLSNVEVKYAGVILVLRGVSLEIRGGKIVALLGSNGAGKTTTLKSISGLLHTELGEVTAGTIEYDGQRIDKLGPEEVAKKGIIQVMEGRQVLEHLTVEENLRLGGYIRKKKSLKQDLDMVYGYFPKLTRLRNSTSGYLSGGEQQMLAMGRAMMAHPKIMLLDEPSMGLAPLVVEEIYAIIERFNAEEATGILVVEQNARAALAVSEFAYVMENGRVVLDGSSAKLAENEDIKEFYLGLSKFGEKRSYRDVKHYKRRKRWL